MMHWSRLHTCLATGRISCRGWCCQSRSFSRSYRLMSSCSNTKQVCSLCTNSSWNLTTLVRSASSSLMTFSMVTWREKRRRDKTRLSTVSDQLHVLMEQTTPEHRNINKDFSLLPPAPFPGCPSGFSQPLSVWSWGSWTRWLFQRRLPLERSGTNRRRSCCTSSGRHQGQRLSVKLWRETVDTWVFSVWGIHSVNSIWTNAQQESHVFFSMLW